jgi:hypothetical protein
MHLSKNVLNLARSSSRPTTSNGNSCSGLAESVFEASVHGAVNASHVSFFEIKWLPLTSGSEEFTEMSEFGKVGRGLIGNGGVSVDDALSPFDSSATTLSGDFNETLRRTGEGVNGPSRMLSVPNGEPMRRTFAGVTNSSTEKLRTRD